MKKSLLIIFGIFTFFTTNAQIKLWGMTAQGGDGFGTIFNLDANGNNQQMVPAFNPNVPGRNPEHQKLLEVSPGIYYGMTSSGGTYGGGVIFEYNYTSNTYTTRFDFGGTNGAFPIGSLTLAANGKLYGLTREGGSSNRGIIFEYDLSSHTFTKKGDLLSANIESPYGTLLEASPGKLYGMSFMGGTSNLGTIFEFDYTTGSLTKKIDLTASEGSSPIGSLMKASNGKLYGMTRDGGSNGVGVIFEYDYVTNTYTKKIDLASITGRTPVSELIEAPNGKLYGMLNGGGATNNGVIFEYDFTSNTFVDKIDLVQINGWSPGGAFLLASNGKLYAMARYGGVNEEGTIFEYDYTTNTFTKQFDLNQNEGSLPVGTLVQASNGKLLGVTSEGGIANLGTIFEFDYNTDNYTKKIDIGSAANGSYPAGSLMLAANGKLYGMTLKGGSNEKGVIFELDPSTNTYTKKADLDSANGSSPYGSMVEGSAGKLYGMTSSGGNSNAGVIFEYDYTTNTYTKKINLNNTIGSSGTGSMIKASNGKLYGMTSGGGANSAGVIFEYDAATNTYTKKVDLMSSPTGSLVEAANGNLYGMTGESATVSQAWIFEYDYNTGMFTNKTSFSAPTGSNPQGSLVLASNNKLYGVTYDGGSNNEGVIFEYDYFTNTLTSVYDMNTAGGMNPRGSLIQASNGKLYGMTPTGGSNGNGVVFEYDYTSDTYTKKVDFTGINGSNPEFTNLVEAGTATGITEKASSAVHVYPNPSSSAITIEGGSEGIYTIFNEMGQSVQSFRLDQSNNYSVKVKDLNTGVYFLTGNTGEKIYRQKIIVTK